MSSDPNKENSPAAHLALDYYQPAFALLHGHLLDSGFPFRETHPIRQRFWKLVPDGRHEPEWGREIICKYLVSVESELKKILSKHSVAYWLHSYRRFLGVVAMNRFAVVPKRGLREPFRHPDNFCGFRPRIAVAVQRHANYARFLTTTAETTGTVAL
jgi:hypothetical protein